MPQTIFALFLEENKVPSEIEERLRNQNSRDPAGDSRKQVNTCLWTQKSPPGVRGRASAIRGSNNRLDRLVYSVTFPKQGESGKPEAKK